MAEVARRKPKISALSLQDYAGFIFWAGAVFS
jgi:hypothetical protein